MQPIAISSSSTATGGRTGPFRIRRTAAPPPELLLPVNPEPSWSSSSAPSSMPSSPNLSGTQMRLGMSPSSSSSFDHQQRPHQHHADDFLHSTMKLFLLVTPPASRFQVTHLNGRTQQLLSGANYFLFPFFFLILVMGLCTIMANCPGNSHSIFVRGFLIMRILYTITL